MAIDKNDNGNEPGFASRHPVMANFLLVILSSLFAIVVIDLVAFYSFDIKRIGTNSDLLFQTSSLLGWEHKPHAEATWHAYKDGTRTHVSINAHGFSDSDRNLEKKIPRIALLGDSTTEFWEVEEKSRGQFILQAMLDDEFEVLNFGLRGAGTDQEYIRLVNQIIHFSPDIVIYYFCISDIANNVWIEDKPYFVLDDDAPGGIRVQGYPVRWPPPTPESRLLKVLEQSFTLRQVKYLLAGIRTHLRTQLPLEEHLELRPFKRTYNAEDERRMTLMKRLISAMHAYTRERDIEFMVVEGVYRPALDESLRQQVLDSYGDQFDFDKVSRTLSDYSEESNIPFLSLQRLIQSRDIRIHEILHPEDTMHLNKKGVELFASSIAEKIRELGWMNGVANSVSDEAR
jgi:lysophospholipase L1-like esterase